MATNIGANQHLAFPTKDQTTVHEGTYAWSCPECTKYALRKLGQGALAHGVRLQPGMAVRPVPQAILPSMPEWATIMDVHFNFHSGDWRLHCFEYGSNVIIPADDVAEVRLPDAMVQRARLAVTETMDQYLPHCMVDPKFLDIMLTDVLARMLGVSPVDLDLAPKEEK